MTTYAQYKPTRFDSHVTLEGREDWLVLPVSITRDSEDDDSLLDLSNWRVAIDWLAKEDCEHEVHRFNHWAVGWFKICLVHPRHAEVVAQMEKSLDNYPVLSEMHWAQLRSEHGLNE